MIKLNPSRNLAARPRAGCFPVLFLLAGWLALVTPLRADNPPSYLFEIDSSAVPGGFQPETVALDSSNHIYVTDSMNSRVLKFSGNGTYLAQWGSYGSGAGQFNTPWGIAVDSSNNVFVVDLNNNRVEKFDSNGNYLTQWGGFGRGNGQFQDPEGIAVDSGNNVYVTDNLNNRVEKFDSNGNYLTQWGSYGSGNGQFNGPAGIATDSSNNVYVADSVNLVGAGVANDRVEKFTSEGNYLTQWGSAGNGNGQFQDPEGIAVDSGNNVYVADSTDCRVENFTSSGTYLTQWGHYSDFDGDFNQLRGIAVDISGNFVCVADTFNYRIQVFVNNANIVPPIIMQQPTNQTVPAGTNVIFTVGVLGTAPFAYQWSSNTVAVPGATHATFTLTNVSLSDSGSTYSVLVTNSFGSVLSRNAVLTVLPALVTTQPASGISATGAVLNGSITVGPDETVAWFDWGTDTNYGNIAGATIVPGNNGSTNIRAALTGLGGNSYHYRMVAANDFGIVYGADQSFTVGFAPTATTLAAVNSTNGSILNATVNPNGWNTSVYFQWVTPALRNSTPGMDIGAGATSLNVSSFVNGLAPFTPYHYQVVASNALGTVFGEVASWNPPFVSVSGQIGVVFTSLHSFGGNDGANPFAGLVQGTDGNLYGTTEVGGTYDEGTVFKMSTNGALNSLHSFTAVNGFLHVNNDGANPFAGLVQGTDANLYGTTSQGGTYGYGFGGGGYGTVFQFSTNGALTTLYAFGTIKEDQGGLPYGGNPAAGLVQGTDGNLYGTTEEGATYENYGTVFRISTNGALNSYFFDGANGNSPVAGLVEGSDGYFYGTTQYGGTNNAGTVFKFSASEALNSLYSFNGTNDGANPSAALVQGTYGYFYGTTQHGGTNGGFGTVFQISTNGMLNSLHSFTGANDGANPRAGLVQGSNGYLYGTTVNGGGSGNGTVFAVNTNGTGFSTLYRFSASSTNSSGVYTNSDGANPQAGLILSGNTLYGTTSAGGSWGDGTVFSLTLPGPQLTITHSGANVILTWPTNAAGYALQSTTNLASPAVWATNSPAPVVIGGQNTVTNPITGGHQFYRLSQ